MKRSSIIWIVVIVVVVVIAGIWWWSASMTGSPSAINTSSNTTAGTGNTNTNAPMIPAGTANSSTSVIVLNTESTGTLGSYLTATNGMTLYEDGSDQQGATACTGACATVWPPYTISASLASSLLGGTPGVSGQIGTVTRADGSIQVTYNGMPLYFYDKDAVVGDTKGQNVGGFTVVTP